MSPNRVRLLGRTAALLGLLLVPALPATAQSTGTVTGRVVDAATQQPLVGAQVLIEGTGLGGLANDDGTYLILNVPAGSHVVQAQMIGYSSQSARVTVEAGQTATVNLTLSQSAIGLDQIVVTGTAGTGQAKRTLGNSVATVSAAEITDKMPMSDPRQLLQGRAPGVTLVQSSGVVGGGSRMRIRGSGSLNAGNEPVVYVDGVRVQSGQVRTEGNTSQPINLLDSFNPNDIESIEVIKGPAAATLYGAEAASGVIQIVTKKGRKAEGLQWTANFEYGQTNWATDQITNYWLCTDARMADLERNPGCGVFTGDEPLEQRLLIDQPLNPKARSKGVLYQYQQRGITEDYPCLFPEQAPCTPSPLRTGTTQNMNVSVRGGGDSYNFYLSGEKSDQEGTFHNNYSNRLGARANFGFVPSEKLNFNVNVGYVQQEQALPQSDNSSNSILRNAYRGEAGGLAGQYLPGFKNWHPEFSNKYRRRIEQERFTMGITAQYTPWEWLQNKATFGLDRREAQNINGNDIDQTGGRLYTGNNAGGMAFVGTDNIWLWTVDVGSTATFDLNTDWSSASSVGMQLTKRTAEGYDIQGWGFVANSLNLIGNAAIRDADQDFSEQTSLGFYFQEQVGFKNRLFLTGAVRIDDNSAFGKDFSLVAYPKASVSWVVSEESFFPSSLGFVDDLKLRAAWGRAGNAPAPFSADRTYGAAVAVVGDEAINFITPDDYGNPNLKAETGDEIELGFDASILQGRVGFDFTFYNKTTKDALLSVDDPPSSGWTGTHLVNVGEINNKGIELGINATPIVKDWLRWDAIVSFSTAHNKLVSFGTDANGNPIMHEDRFGDFLSVQRHREGYPLGGYWATDVQRDAQGRPILGPDGVALLEPCDSWAPEDRANCREEFIGSPFPTRLLGLTNTLELFRNLQLYAFLDYQGGHYQWCAICSVRTRTDQNSKERNDPRLDPSHPDYEEWGRYELGLLRSQQTKRYIMPADFLKLREVSATYTLPTSWVERAGLDRASVTLAGRNLWMWTKYKGSADPEVAFTGDAAFGTSDYGSIPMQRRWLLSFNVNF
jgi:TonB-linked SusC/RagA family outer membrane protein